MAQHKIDITGIEHAVRGYVVWELPRQASLWVVEPERMVSHKKKVSDPAHCLDFDCLDYVFVDDLSKPGLLGGIYLRVQRKGKGLISIRPLLVNHNGTTLIYDKGADALPELHGVRRDTELLRQASEGLIKEAYTYLGKIYGNGNPIPASADRILRPGLDFDVDSFLRERNFRLTNRFIYHKSN